MDIIEQCQQLLKTKNLDAYLIPTSDPHQSEYISDHFKTRAFLTGFTGSAGTLLITQKDALLWVDGRYHIQAEQQIKDRPIRLMKQGLTTTPSIEEYLKKAFQGPFRLGFDGHVLSASFVLNLCKNVPNIQLNDTGDIIDPLWNDRPPLPFSMLYYYDVFFSGKTYQEKRTDVKTAMKENHCSIHILSSLEDQAWLYNLRANDIVHTPVFLAYTVLTDDDCHLFVDPDKIDKTVELYLKENEINVHPYSGFYTFLSKLTNQTILMDDQTINYTIYHQLKDQNNLVLKPNPTLKLKAIKNKTEIKHTKQAHIKDGVAFTKWMYLIKNKIGTIPLSERSAAKMLEEQRKQQEGFIDLSFDTICAYQANAAMMHYSATDASDASLKPEGFLLVDSGGHYLEGTTDITRTIALGQLTDAMKQHFTTVLKSVIALSEVVFLQGMRGDQLDILARGPIWKLRIDYQCGTGHGVGHLLSVHEGPNSFRFKKTTRESAVLEEGMITTNEPGIYLENEYGIRIENELLCVAKEKNMYGQFLGFQTITLAPIDLDAICMDRLTEDEKNWLNDYHQTVYDTLKPYLTEDEKNWLKKYTAKLE